MTSDTKERLYRPNELDESFGIPRQLVFKEIAAGRLRSFKVGRSRYITTSAVIEWMQAREAEARMN